VSELQTTIRFRIHDGKLDEFKGLAAQCLHIVREKDTGTLQYDWFLSADGREAVLRERYRDSAAVLEHAMNLGDLTGRIVGVSDPEVELFGAPSEELLAALAMLQPRVYSAFQSI
jgi:quinol monooxygenase YgiN